MTITLLFWLKIIKKIYLCIFCGNPGSKVAPDQGFEPTTHRSPVRCHDHQATMIPSLTIPSSSSTLAMGPGQMFLTGVRLGQFFVLLIPSQPSSVWFWVWKISKFFSLRVKEISSGQVKKVLGSKAGRPLIYCGSKVCSGWVGSGPISATY